MHMTEVFKILNVWPKKLNHIFSDGENYCLLLIYTKQLGISKQFWEKHYILKAEQGFLDGGIYWSFDCRIYTLSS